MTQTDNLVEAPEISEANYESQLVPFLVSKILVFVDFLSSHPLRPYQMAFAYRMVESVLVEDVADLTALFARQSGKSETVCNVVAALMILLPRLAKIYPQHRRLAKFKEGLLVGIFAPTEGQAEVLFGRLVDRLTSEHAQEIFRDQEIDDKVDGKAKRVRLTRCGSRALMMTANPKAKIEAQTFHLILIDEAQDCDDYIVRKSITPMKTATAGTMVRTGTPTIRSGDFKKTIDYNKRKSANVRGAKQNHFEADWREVAKYSPEYKKTLMELLEQQGEDSEEFQMSYCVAPDTNILTSDLTHIPACKIEVGMQLVGFDEDQPGKGLHRKYQPTTVVDVGRITRPCYELTLSDGTTVTSSAEHRWLVMTPSGRTIWKTTEALTYTDRIVKLTDVWDTERSYESGYLAAAFEGEGCLSSSVAGQLDLCFAQKDNVMLDQVRLCLTRLGYDYRETCYEADRGVVKLHIAGGRSEVLRFLGEVRPARLLDKVDVGQLGALGRHDKGRLEHPTVVEKWDVGDREVVAMKTTTGTFVAEGLASHNCLKWMLGQGMFTTDTRFDELGDVSMQELVKTWTRTPVVVGIDPARSVDSTVVTVCFVDWDRPDEYGFYTHRVLNWLELQNMPFEEQYAEIIRFLDPYNIFAVAVDAQGMGGAVAERLQILLRYKNCEVIGLPSHPSEQNKRWKHLQVLMDRALIGWPAGAKVRRLRSFKRFQQQMVDAEKHFQGPNIMVRAPDEAGAHDDYVDSLALATYCTADLSVPEAEQINNPFFGR